MRRRVATNTGLITKVNVTPIIDVALVLVIILLVTAPLMSVADLPVELPKAQTRDAEDERNVSITLSAQGHMAVDENIIAPDALQATLRERLAQPGNDDVLVIVRADSGAPYSQVKHVLEEARAAGATRLAIATRQRGRSDR